MKRREFIAGLGTAAAWPLAARPQQGERMRRIGALMNVTSDDPESSLRVAAFSQGLQELGWSVGRNVRIDWRWAGADRERARTYAAEWVALAPEVVLTAGLGVRPMLQATRTVPIVFAGLNDPVGAGVVRSLARPGGNITGFRALDRPRWRQTRSSVEPAVVRIPRQGRGALGCEPLKAAGGVTDAAPVVVGRLKAACQRHRCSCSRRLCSSSCFLMYSRISSVSWPTVENEVSPRPEALPYEIPLPFSIHTGQVYRALALDKPDHLRR